MSRPKLPPPAVGLSTGSSIDGQPRLVGTVPRDLVVPAGTTVTLRRLRREAADDAGADYVLVFGTVTHTVADEHQGAAERDARWLRKRLPKESA